MKHSHRSAALGLLLLLPASILISAGVLEFNVPGFVVHPVAVMGGLLGALVVNLLAIVRVRAERQQDGGIAAVTVRIGTKAANLAVVAICALLLATILGYLFVENYQPRLIE
jgi:hypothetical protein